MKWWPAIGAAVAAAIAGGCGATGATKAGPQNGPTVLRMASRDSSLASDAAAAYFANRVAELSRGAVEVKGIGPWGRIRPGAEQQIVRDVAGGKVDLGAVGTRVLDTLGTTSFQALTAPMLIDNYRLEAAVIASDMPRRMLKGLRLRGVTGLA